MEATIVTGSKTIIHNVLRCVEKADLSVDGILLLPLAPGRSVFPTMKRTWGSSWRISEVEPRPWLSLTKGMWPLSGNFHRWRLYHR